MLNYALTAKWALALISMLEFFELSAQVATVFR